jgi:two-component system NtrC family sensor kinase
MERQKHQDMTVEANAMDGPANKEKISKQFKRLRLWLSAGLIFCFALPLLVLSSYFHTQFNATLKNSEKLSLSALSESQRNTIDLYLQERVVNLFSLFHYTELNLKPIKQEMEYYLENLRQSSDSFVDVGFINPKGIQTGYAGPFDYLQGKDYSNETWHKNLIQQDKNYIISDIYLGFRNKPHFTIATKQMIDGKFYIMRATLDPDKFYRFLRVLSLGKNVDSSIINDKGVYQIVDPGRGKLLGKSDFIPLRDKETGFKEMEKGLIVFSWLTEANWALIVRQPSSAAHLQMLKERKILTISILGILLIMTTAIIYAVKKILGHAEVEAEKRQEMSLQLIHASKLASVGELATGVAHEINNPLAIISSTSGVIKDMLDPQFKLDSSPEKILEELSYIDTAVFRARNITQQLLSYGRKNEPSLVPCNLNTVIKEIVVGVKEKELLLNNIELNLNFDSDLPEISLDPDQIRQVFLNLINNAQDAISGPGAITITTKAKEDKIHVEFQDTGEGMTTEQIKQIFNPFYTTKEIGKGTGLGLSVSLGIVESIGGTMEVQSIKGSGSIFSIDFPLDDSKGGING